MGTVTYSAIVSLDGYIEDADGDFQALTPDEEVHALCNEQALAASAFLFGRRLFETMEEPWTTAARRTGLPKVEADFAAAYVATPRYVFSDTLQDVPEGVTLVRRAEARATVARLRDELDGSLDLGGAELAASLIDCVDAFCLHVLPVTLGGGTPFFPAGSRLRLRLAEQRVHASGALSLRYGRA